MVFVRLDVQVHVETGFEQEYGQYAVVHVPDDSLVVRVVSVGQQVLET